jgi:hypothetical protein
VLREAGIPLTDQEENQLEEQKPNQKIETRAIGPSENKSTPELYQAVLKTFLEQSEG